MRLLGQRIVSLAGLTCALAGCGDPSSQPDAVRPRDLIEQTLEVAARSKSPAERALERSVFDLDLRGDGSLACRHVVRAGDRPRGIVGIDLRRLVCGEPFHVRALPSRAPGAGPRLELRVLPGVPTGFCVPIGRPRGALEIRLGFRILGAPPWNSAYWLYVGRADDPRMAEEGGRLRLELGKDGGGGDVHGTYRSTWSLALWRERRERLHENGLWDPAWQPDRSYVLSLRLGPATPDGRIPVEASIADRLEDAPILALDRGTSIPAIDLPAWNETWYFGGVQSEHATGDMRLLVEELVVQGLDDAPDDPPQLPPGWGHLDRKEFLAPPGRTDADLVPALRHAVARLAAPERDARQCAAAVEGAVERLADALSGSQWQAAFVKPEALRDWLQVLAEECADPRAPHPVRPELDSGFTRNLARAREALHRLADAQDDRDAMRTIFRSMIDALDELARACGHDR